MNIITKLLIIYHVAAYKTGYLCRLVQFALYFGQSSSKCGGGLLH